MAAYTGTFPESLFYWEVPDAPVWGPSKWTDDGDKNLYWTPPTQAFTSYELQESSNNGVTWSASTSITDWDEVESWHRYGPLTGYTVGSLYAWRIRAVNPAGPGAWSDTYFGLAQEAASEPLNLVATPGDSEVTLTWDAPAAVNGGTIDQYGVWFRLSTDPTYTNVTYFASASTRTYTVTGLTNGTSYDFRVRALKSSMDWDSGFGYATVTASPGAGDEVADDAPVTITVIPAAVGSLTGTQEASGGLDINVSIPTAASALEGSQAATDANVTVTASLPTADASLTGDQEATADETAITVSVPTASAYREGTTYSEADIIVTVEIPEAEAGAEGVVTAEGLPVVVTASIPEAHAYFLETGTGDPVIVTVEIGEATGEKHVPAYGGVPLDEDSGPAFAIVELDAFADLEAPIAQPTGGLIDPLSGDWILEPTASDPLAEAGVEPEVGAVYIPANTGEGMLAEYEVTEDVAPMPAKALVRVSPQMPSPASRLGRLGQPRPNQFVPTSVVTEVYGRLRVVIEGRDVTYHRGVPCEVVSVTESEPFGPESAVIRFPSLSPFQSLTGRNQVFREGNDIKITIVSADGTETIATLFEGYIVERESAVTTDDVGVTIQCQGALYYADFSMAQPKLKFPYADIGRKIASRLNPTKRRRWRRIGLDQFQTGIMTTHRGAWEPVLTGFVGDLLAMATTDDGTGQWTMHLDPGRKPVVRLKDRTNTHHSLTLGTPGVSVSLRRDATSGVSTIYGQGVDDQNRAYANLKIPFHNPETPDFQFPYADPDAVMSLGDTDAGTWTGDGVSRVQKRLRDAGYRVKVTGTYNEATADAVRAWQRSTGGDVTGELGGQTWASLMMVGTGAGIYGKAYYAPFATLSKVEPWIYNADGSKSVRNPNYDDDAFRIERFRVFPDGTSKRDASRAAKAELNRDKDPGWIGNITMNVDPESTSRWAIRAGQNILVKGWEGSNLLLHIVSVTKSPNAGTVSLEVDSKARDLLTLDAVVRRDRDNLSPGARRRGAKQTAMNTAPNPIVDSELTGWVIRHAVEAQKWTVLRVPIGIEGSIVGVELDTNLPARFACAIFTDRVTPAALNRLVGNPLMYRVDELRPFPGDEETATKLAGLGWVDTIGGPEQAAGYWPGAESDGSPLTGKHRDNSISIPFESRRPPFIWIATWADTATFLEGRFLRDPQRW